MLRYDCGCGIRSRSHGLRGTERRADLTVASRSSPRRVSTGRSPKQIGGDLVDVTSIVSSAGAGSALVRAERPRPARREPRRPRDRERRGLRRLHRRAHRSERPDAPGADGRGVLVGLDRRIGRPTPATTTATTTTTTSKGSTSTSGTTSQAMGALAQGSSRSSRCSPPTTLTSSTPISTPSWRASPTSRPRLGEIDTAARRRPRSS